MEVSKPLQATLVLVLENASSLSFKLDLIKKDFPNTSFSYYGSEYFTLRGRLNDVTVNVQSKS